MKPNTGELWMCTDLIHTTVGNNRASFRITGPGLVVHPDSREHHGGSHRYRVLLNGRLTWFYNYELVKVK